MGEAVSGAKPKISAAGKLKTDSKSKPPSHRSDANARPPSSRGSSPKPTKKSKSPPKKSKVKKAASGFSAVGDQAGSELEVVEEVQVESALPMVSACITPTLLEVESPAGTQLTMVISKVTFTYPAGGAATPLTLENAPAAASPEIA